MRTRFALLPAAVIAVSLVAGNAYGSGFSLQDFDAKALGMSNAFAATADNASAVFFNPAGMSQLDGMQGEMSLVYIQGYTHFSPDNPALGEANAKNNPIFFPTGFGTVEINNFLHFGIGMFSPYGLSIDWGRGYAGRYNVTKAKVEAIEINPNVSFKIPLGEGTSIALAAGFGVVRSALKFEFAVDLSPAGAEDGLARLFGDTDDHMNLTWNMGLLVSLLDKKLRIGFTYRAPVDEVQLHGTAEFYSPTNPSTGAPFINPDTTPVFTRLKLPDQIRAGVAVQPMDALTVEADFTWTNWSNVDKVIFEFDRIGRTSVLDFGLNDSWFVGIGADYKVVKDLLAVRAGVYYDETPTRLETRTPALPDNDRKGFSLGLGITPIPALSIDVGYLTVFFNTAVKRNDIGADKVAGGEPRGTGEYDTFGHVAAITVGLKF